MAPPHNIYIFVNTMQATYSINTESDLPVAARFLLDASKGKKIIAFYGEMGVGKTTLIKVICKELGVTDTISSPTYSIVNEYRDKNNTPIYHFDFYRIKDIREAYDMGYENYFFSGNYCFIEWPEKIENILPEGCVKIKLELEGGKRKLTIL